MNEQEILSALGQRSEFENKLVAKAIQDEGFKRRLLNEPKSVYAEELGQEIPDSVNIQVVEESANTTYLVLPRKLEEAGAEGELSDEALEAVAGGRAFISTRVRSGFVISF
jgi:hypothetical protein